MERNAVELCVKLHMTQHSRKKKLFKIPFSHTIWCALYHILLFHDVFDGLPQFFCVFFCYYSSRKQPTASYCVHRKNFPSHVKFVWADVYSIIDCIYLENLAAR